MHVRDAARFAGRFPIGGARAIPSLSLALLLGAILGLGGCSILPENEPVHLVDPRLEVEPGRHGASRPWTLNIARPETDPVRDSARVLVRTPDGQLQVHPTARWVAPAPELVRTALVRYLRDAEVLAQVGASASGSDRTLVIDLRRFEIARDASGSLAVAAQADARLYESASADRVGRLSFDHAEAIDSASVAEVVRGTQAVLELLARRTGDWLAEH
ncbi:ABC-type transport auxiliary lipoprotein family protein [Halomonas denitrificans]|nr:membrane integrity-associated transporter subunit PqiC [Halomonas denitrificans]